MSSPQASIAKVPNLQERDVYRNTPSILATLQCLPEVVEMNSDSAWQMFLALQSDERSQFSPTEPSGAQPLDAGVLDARTGGPLTVQDVMVEARRLNRVSPCAPEWQDLYAMMIAAGLGEPPPPMTGPEASRTPALVQRIRLRDQVEWAAQQGILDRVFHFFKSLPENRWVHIGK
jgi:hypothetical protein